MPYDPEALLKDPTTSFWFKDALRAALLRDPVDAVNDAEVLLETLTARLELFQPTRKVPGLLLAVFLTARLVISFPTSDIPLQQAGQTSAPECLSTYDCSH